MALIPVTRLTSGINTQTDSTSRENAVEKAINKLTGDDPTQDSVLIGNVPKLWPELSKYENDTSGSGSPDIISVPPPQFIWNQASFPAGQVQYFAQAYQIESGDQHVVFVAVFADNAHELYIEEYTPEGEFAQRITPEDGLTDGLMVASASLTDDTDFPFNWQKVRLWSSSFEPLNADGYLVISFKAINYDAIDSVNPAGLAYLVDVYREEEG
ncbi:MAG TPA: hypothetical protein GX505_13175 [Clostridiales bacterium]|nr:hypothetical protein [Clostridiales bacterium]